MIVYNVGRRWFAKKEDADAFRIANGWKPAELAKITVNDREQLAALLDALCEPPAQPVGTIAASTGLTEEIVDRAYAPNLPDDWMPSFLLSDEHRRLREARKAVAA